MKKASKNRIALIMAACALAVGSGALAQGPRNAPPAQISDMEPPTPPAPRVSKGNIVQMFVAIGLAALVIGVNLIPSKRGHQD